MILFCQIDRYNIPCLLGFISLTTKGLDLGGFLVWDTSFPIKLSRYKDEKTNNYSNDDGVFAPRSFWGEDDKKPSTKRKLFNPQFRGVLMLLRQSALFGVW